MNFLIISLDERSIFYSDMLVKRANLGVNHAKVSIKLVWLFRCMKNKKRFALSENLEYSFTVITSIRHDAHCLWDCSCLV